MVLSSLLGKLKDPYLVRGIQEWFGVKVIEATCTYEDNDGSINKSQFSSSVDHSRHKPLSPSDVTQPTSSGNGVLSLAVKAIKTKKRTRRKPTALYVMDSPPSSSPEAGTPPPELADIDVETYPVLDHYFKFITMVGYEPFFITALPYLNWNVDVLLARQLCFIFAVAIYVGSACKNIFKLVRPSSPPAIRLEVSQTLEQEYGFPSSHAIIGAVFSAYLLYACSTRYEFIYPMLLFSIIWVPSISISRVYLGVHTVLDVTGGALIGIVATIFTIPFLDQIDAFTFNTPHFNVVALAIVVVLLIIYPVTNQWSMDRGDAAAILGAALGMHVGAHMNGPLYDDLISTGPFEVTIPSSQAMGYNCLRFIIGILLVFPTRFIMKLLCFRLLPAIMPDQGILEVHKRPLVELPYKIITYSSLGFTMVYVCPIVFELCQVARE